MDYANNIKQSYSLDLSSTPSQYGGYLMLSNGDTHYVAYDSNRNSTYEEIVSYYANYSNREYESYLNMLLFYDNTEDYYYLFSRNICDFVVTESVNSTYQSLLLYAPHENSDVSLFATCTTYMSYTATGSFINYTYGEQNVSNITNGKKLITDYSNIKASNNYSTYDNFQYVVRGENTILNMFVNGLYFSSANELKVSYGSPYYDIRETARENGYSAGYGAGWVNGQDYGYEIGLNSHVDENTYTAFGYIAQTFNAVAGILNLEVLPHITLGLCFSIPLMFVLMLTIFRLVKK